MLLQEKCRGSRDKFVWEAEQHFRCFASLCGSREVKKGRRDAYSGHRSFR
jgi:hypothetical protein